MKTIAFFVAGIPKPQPRARSFAVRGKGGKPVLTKDGQPIIRAYESATAEGWKSQIALAAKDFVPMPPLQGPLRVDIEFVFPRPTDHFRTNGELKGWAPYWHDGHIDLDNCFKAATDALTTLGMWCDDGQICAGVLLKHYGPRPGAHIRIGSPPQPKHESVPMELELGAV